MQPFNMNLIEKEPQLGCVGIVATLLLCAWTDSVEPSLLVSFSLMCPLLPEDILSEFTYPTAVALNTIPKRLYHRSLLPAAIKTVIFKTGCSTERVHGLTLLTPSLSVCPLSNSKKRVDVVFQGKYAAVEEPC